MPPRAENFAISVSNLMPNLPSDRRALSARLNHYRAVARTRGSRWIPPTRLQWERWHSFLVGSSSILLREYTSRMDSLSEIDMDAVWPTWNWERSVESEQDFVMVVVLISMNIVAECNAHYGVRPSDKVDYILPFGGNAGNRDCFVAHGNLIHAGERTVMIRDSLLDDLQARLHNRDREEFWRIIVQKYDSLHFAEPHTNSPTQIRELLESLVTSRNGPAQSPPDRLRDMIFGSTVQSAPTPRRTGRVQNLNEEYISRPSKVDNSMSTDMIMRLIQKKKAIPGPIRDAIYELLIKDQVDAGGSDEE